MKSLFTQEELHDFNSAISRLTMTLNLMETNAFRDDEQKKLYVEGSKDALKNLQKIYSAIQTKKLNPEVPNEG